MKREEVKNGDRVKYTQDNKEFRGIVSGIHKDGNRADISVYGQWLLQCVKIKDLEKDTSKVTKKEKKFTSGMNSLRSISRR